MWCFSKQFNFGSVTWSKLVEELTTNNHFWWENNDSSNGYSHAQMLDAPKWMISICIVVFFLGGGRGTLILMVEWQELAWCMTFWFFGGDSNIFDPVRFQNRDPLFHWKTTPNCLSKTKKNLLANSMNFSNPWLQDKYPHNYIITFLHSIYNPAKMLKISIILPPHFWNYLPWHPKKNSRPLEYIKTYSFFRDCMFKAFC